MRKIFFSTYTKKMALFSIGAIFLIILDRLFKTFARLLWSNQEITLNSWLHLNYSLNNYLAFSLPANKYFILTAVLVLLFIITAVWLKNIKAQNWQALLWFAIVLGAMSNLLDRLLYGGVIDYIAVSWFTTFNLADAMITLGVIILLLQEFNSKNDNHKT